MHRLLRPRMGASLVVERSRDRRRMAAGGGTAAVPFGKRRGRADARQGGDICMKVLVTGANGQLGRALAATVPTEITLVTLDRAALDIGDEQAVRARGDVERTDLLANAAA